MEDRDRRQFLSLVGTGGLALAAASSFPGPAAAAPRAAGSGHPDRRITLDLLRTQLGTARRQIKSLYLDFNTEYVYIDPAHKAKIEDEAWLVEGRCEMFYRPGYNRIVRENGDVIFTHIRSPNRYLKRVHWVDGIRDPETFYDGPLTDRHRPRISIEKFLPVPRDRPMYEVTAPNAGGNQSVRVIGQDNVRFFVDEDLPAVVKMEVFRTSTEVAESIVYSDHQEIMADVHFPLQITASKFVGSVEKTRLRLHVSGLQVNQSLAENIFSFEGIQK